MGCHSYCYHYFNFVSTVLICSVDGAKGIFGGIFSPVKHHTTRAEQTNSYAEVSGRGGSFRVEMQADEEEDGDYNDEVVYRQLLDTFRDEVREITAGCREELRQTCATVVVEIQKARALKQQEAEEAALDDEEAVIDKLLDSLSSEANESASDEGQWQDSLDVFTDLLSVQNEDDCSYLEESDNAVGDGAIDQGNHNAFVDVLSESDFVVGDTDEEEEKVINRLFGKAPFFPRINRTKKEKEKNTETKARVAFDRKIHEKTDVIHKATEPVMPKDDESVPINMRDNTEDPNDAKDGVTEFSKPDIQMEMKNVESVAAKRATEGPMIEVPDSDLEWENQVDSESDIDKAFDAEESSTLVDTTAKAAILSAVRLIARKSLIALCLLLAYMLGKLLRSIVVGIWGMSKSA